MTKRKQISIEPNLHAAFKSYCSGVEKKSIKVVISNMIENELTKNNFNISAEQAMSINNTLKQY